MIAQFNGFEINPIQSKDAWGICNLVVANEDRFKLYFPKTLEQNLTPSLSELFVKNKVKRFENKEEFLFTLKEQKNNTVAGLIYIKELNWTTKQGEFAYCIGYPYKGKGLTSKAIKTLSDYAFKMLGLKTLQIIVFKTNIGSVKVAENNGFKWIKTLEKAYTPPGHNPLDMELYELYK